MWRCRPFTKLVPLLLVAALPWCGCASRSGSRSNPASLALTARLPVSGTVPVQQASALRSDLINAEGQIQQLEQQLSPTMTMSAYPILSKQLLSAGTT